MKESPAKCKFCNADVTLSVHEDSLDMFDMEFWAKLAACNRCADYHTKRFKIIRAIQWFANSYMMAKAANHKNAEEMGDECRGNVNELTKKLANNAGSHYRAPYTWEPDWVVQIMENPGNATLSCQFYERQMWKDWNRRMKAMKEAASE